MKKYYEYFDLNELRCGISEITMEKLYPPGTLIYNEGDKPSGLFYLQSGLVGLSHISEGGNESMLRIFSPKTFFGHRSFLAEEAYHATAITLKKSKVLFISEAHSKKLIKEQSDLKTHFLKIMAKDLAIAEKRLGKMTSEKVFTRVIEALIFLKNKHPDYNWTRREIGEFSGAKTETVSRVLSQLEEKNYIIKNGRKIQIKNEIALINEINKNRK